MMTWLMTLIPLGGMWFLCLLAGWVISGNSGIVVVFATTLAGAVFLPRLPIRMVMKLMKGRPLPPQNAPGLYSHVARICERAELKSVPDLYLVDGPPNAFSSGSGRHSGLAISSSLLSALRPEEVVAVLAHEIAHIKHGDVGLSRFAELLTRLGRVLAITGLAIAFVTVLLGERVEAPVWGLWILAFMPLILTMLQLAQARQREFLADETAARLTGAPISMARALHKIERGQKSPFRRLMSDITRSADIPPWLRTHPPTEARIQRLLDLENTRTS